MYATYSDCSVRYPILSKWNPSSVSAVNSDLVYYAEKEIDGRLASHFAVPFTDVPPTISDLTIDYVYLKMLRSRDLDKAAEFEKILDARIERLKEGEEYIFTESGTTIAPAGASDGVWSNTKDYYPVHSILDADSPYAGFDSDMIDDEEDIRS